MSADVRWKQRFANFEKALGLLREALARPVLSRLEKEGVIQRFEYTFELAWKTLQDYLRHGGIETGLPRDVLKQAFAAGIVRDGQTWIEMLESRNLMSHAYDEATFEKAFGRIRGGYSEALGQVFEFLRGKI